MRTHTDLSPSLKSQLEPAPCACACAAQAPARRAIARCFAGVLGALRALADRTGPRGLARFTTATRTPSPPRHCRPHTTQRRPDYGAGRHVGSASRAGPRVIGFGPPRQTRCRRQRQAGRPFREAPCCCLCCSVSLPGCPRFFSLYNGISSITHALHPPPARTPPLSLSLEKDSPPRHYLIPARGGR
jgi:hypothetical protein